MPDTPATLASVEAALIASCRGSLVQSGMSTAVSTPDAPNPDTLRAISWAMKALGHPPASFLMPTDDELASVADPYLLLRLARYDLLGTVLQYRQSLIASESAQSRSITYSNVTGTIQGEREMLAKQLARFLIGPAVGGRINIRTVASRRGPGWEL